jgi:hypothetical protein
MKRVATEIALGHNQSNALSRNPILRQTYEEYTLCRTTQLVVFRKPLKGGQEKLVSVVWPTGFSILPQAGGLDDQSYLVTRLFAACLRGEQEGVARLMKKA